MILPLAALLTVAGSFGLWLGVNAVPPGETEIIDAAAAIYMEETGGRSTDCHATPGAVAGVRLVVVCGADWAVAFDRWGREIAVPAGPEGPST